MNESEQPPPEQKGPAPLPAETVTFLMTDIEGSVRLWEASPDLMRDALMRHDVLAGEIAARHGGRQIKSRGEGDSLFLVFPAVADAVTAACVLQQAYGAEPWPTASPLRVRMALHTGEAEQRDGDYYGGAVNRCARLRAAAHGGQVLLSATVGDLVRAGLPPQPACGTWGRTACGIWAARSRSISSSTPLCRRSSPRSAPWMTPPCPTTCPCSLRRSWAVTRNWPTSRRCWAAHAS